VPVQLGYQRSVPWCSSDRLIIAAPIKVRGGRSEDWLIIKEDRLIIKEDWLIIKKKKKKKTRSKKEGRRPKRGSCMHACICSYVTLPPQKLVLL